MSPTSVTEKSLSGKQVVLRTAAQHSLVSFSQIVDPRYQVNWHHDLIARKLEQALRKVVTGQKARIILQLPPRHGKSELATIKFPAWVLGSHPEIPFIVSSYSANLAEDFGQKTRDVMNEPNYQAVFNTRLRGDTTAKGRWLTENGGGYTATGVGGAITGRGFKIGIIDDPFKNREEAESDLIREKVWNWYTSTFYTRQEGYSAIIVICTRWHTDDLVGRLLEEERRQREEKLTEIDEWEVVRLPAVAEEDEPQRKKGEPLWPEKFSLANLDNIRNTVGLYDWVSLYQQSPITSESQEFRKSWFKERSWEEVAKLKTRNFLAIDTAISKAASADYTGISRNYVDPENNWNLKAYRVRVNPKELIDLIFTLHNTDHYEKIGIEKTIYYETLKPFLDDERRRRNNFPDIVPLEHHQTAKELRIRGLIPRYESGSIYHVRGECRDLEQELLMFPKATHDDVSDATAYLLQLATLPGVRTGTGRPDQI